MILQASGQVAWDDAEDKDLLRQFLESRTGQRLISRLADEAPPLLGSGDTNAIMIRSGEARGFALVVQKMVELAYPPTLPKAPSTPYPSLEDDTQWQDGETLNPPKQGII